MRTCQYCQKSLKEKQRKNCAGCKSEAKRKRNQRWHANNKEHRRQKDKMNHRSPSYRWCLLKQNGKKRNLEVSLSRDEFENISRKPCYYCVGKLDTDSGWGSHIDRLDNLEGYTTKNSVSCCDFCNRIKQDLLTCEEAKAVICVIIKLRSNKNENNNTNQINTRISN